MRKGAPLGGAAFYWGPRDAQGAEGGAGSGGRRGRRYDPKCVFDVVRSRNRLRSVADVVVGAGAGIDDDQRHGVSSGWDGS